jgi:hypothetical protein
LGVAAGKKGSMKTMFTWHVEYEVVVESTGKDLFRRSRSQMTHTLATESRDVEEAKRLADDWESIQATFPTGPAGKTVIFGISEIRAVGSVLVPGQATNVGHVLTPRTPSREP